MTPHAKREKSLKPPRKVFEELIKEAQGAGTPHCQMPTDDRRNLI